MLNNINMSQDENYYYYSGYYHDYYSKQEDEPEAGKPAGSSKAGEEESGNQDQILIDFVSAESTERMKLSKNLKRTFGCSLLLLASLFWVAASTFITRIQIRKSPSLFRISRPVLQWRPRLPIHRQRRAQALAAPIHASYAPGSISSMPATPLPPATGGTSTQSAGSASILQKGDMVSVTFSDIPLPGMPEVKQRIPDDGKLSLPLDVNVQAVGKTGFQLEQEIKALYVPKYFVRLTVSVKSDERWYYVGGEVRTANRYVYSGDLTVLRAIDTAGGFSDFADKKKIELRRANGQMHMVSQKEALKDPRKDLPVYPNDQIIVHKRFW